MKAGIFLVAFLLLVACSKVNQENFAKIQDGMSEEQVTAILGKPTESRTVDVLGISGTTSSWVSGDATITVRFVGGKAALKTYNQPTAKK